MARIDVHTAATEQPVSLTTAAEHLRVVDPADHGLIQRLVRSATERLQRRHWTQFCAATLDEWFDGWGADGFSLRINPVASVEEVAYIDAAGVEQAVEAGVWELGREHGRAIVRTAYGQSWPSGCRGGVDSVRVRYVAGYGAQAAVPGPVVDALLIEVGDLYLLRDSVVPAGMRRVERMTDHLMAGYSYRTTGRP